MHVPDGFFDAPTSVAAGGVALVGVAACLRGARRELDERTAPLAGLVAAFVFVFVPTIGEFVTPLLVGGTSGYMYGNAIQDLFTRSLDWQTGSVLAIFLLAVVAGLMLIFGRYIQVRSVAAD